MRDLRDRPCPYDCDSDRRSGCHYLNYSPDRGSRIVRVKNRHHVLPRASAGDRAPLVHPHAVTVAASVDGQLSHAPAAVRTLIEREQRAREYVAPGGAKYEANVVAAHGEPPAIRLEDETGYPSRRSAPSGSDLPQRPDAAALRRRILRQVAVQQGRELR